MDLTSISFWEQFHNRHGVRQGEWYFPYEQVAEFIRCYVFEHDLAPLLALHCGSGEYPTQVFGGTNDPFITVNFDYATSCLSKTGTDLEIMIANALSTPYRSHSFDIIIEKGLFDSVTSTGSVSKAYELLSEYHRLLCNHSSAVVFIFSIFGPNAEKKDMMGLLCHEKLQVECRSLYKTPAELPDQDFCFVYIVRNIAADEKSVSSR